MYSRQFQILSRTQTKRFLLKHGYAALQVLNFKLPWIHKMWNNRGKTKGCMKHVRKWGMFQTPILGNILQHSSFPADVLEVPKRFPQDPVKILVKMEELTLERIQQFSINTEVEECKPETPCDLYETLTISQAVLCVNNRRKQSGWVGVWRSDSSRSVFSGVLLQPSSHDQLGSSVYSLRVVILVLLPSRFILKSGVIFGFLSAFPPVWLGCPA